MNVSFSSGSRASFLLLFVFALLCFSSISVAQQKSADSLNTYLSQAKNLWAAGESDLQLAVSLLSVVSKNGRESYYGLATDFYYWSLKNANFQEEKKIIKDELERTKPLVPDSTKKTWTGLFENSEPLLLDELAGFWEVNDSYISTETNERLIEHWQRIHYAREHFDRAKQPPYGTDERGIYYVRLGTPGRTVTKNLQLNYVIGPEGSIFNFELGNVIHSEVEIWEYPELGDNFFLMFGYSNGWGEYGLRNSAMELIPDDIRIQLRSSGFRSYNVMKDLSQSIAQYGIYEQLAPLHDHFRDMFSHMQTVLSSYSIGYSNTNKFIQASFTAEPLSQITILNNLNSAPAGLTTTVPDKGTLKIQKEVYRFITEDGKRQFVLSVLPKPTSESLNNMESLFISNSIIVYDNNWNPIAKFEEPRKVTDSLLSKPMVYMLDEPLNNYPAYFSSELIDTTMNNTFIPGKITQKASSIIATSGREKLNWPTSLDKDETLLISDIIVGPDQKITDNRIPITPSRQHIYEAGTDLMVYFEAYNIPEGGYAFEYYFEKHRWLIGNKRPDEKPSVTIINDKLKSDRNSQLFSISLSDLDEGTYDLIFEFRPLEQDGEQQTVKTRKIELEVTG